MTCIVGIVKRKSGNILIGGDSAAVDVSSGDMSTRKGSKVFESLGFVYGYTSSFRMGDILQYSFVPPPINDLSVDNYIRTCYIDSLRECLEKKGYGHKKDGDVGGDFLVGFRGRLFHIRSDYQVGESTDFYDACGIGRSIALGALHATKDLRVADDRRIMMALSAAEAFSAYVRGPFNIVEQKS